MSFEKVIRETKSKTIISIFLGLILIGTVAGAFITAPHPVTQDEGKSSLIIMTYNIRLGVNLTGEKNYDGQLELIRSVDPDILCLQESDTARIGGGNSDVVRYLADKLDMYSYRGAKTVFNTYGTAILSKYPILNTKAFFTYSTHQQISTAQAEIRINSTLSFNVFSNHPAARGEDAKRYQIEQILSQITGLDNVLLGGDFNFRPYSEPYNITTGILEDSWVQKWSSPAEGRIDHIFLSSGITVLDAVYIERGQSDHPAYWIEIQI
jgi:endonuclease/exonuclease/phosphatase family metal-dependent hydrolase